MLMAEFTAKHPFTFSYKPVGKHVIDGKTPFKWEITLGLGSRKYVFDYTMGAAYVSYRPKERGIKPRQAEYHVLQERLKRVLYGESMLGTGLVPTEPELRDVLYALHTDCSMVENCMNFAEFCAEFGFNADSIKDKACYDACIMQHIALRGMMGTTTFLEFLSLESE
jgi:hypothetical protein